ncbi:MAG TPA: FAD:protein FMN transferase [Gammaproteobacteria bacterium]|nr:FAD:protein FMN transferase [Gammaproteobacteria bacterium]
MASPCELIFDVDGIDEKKIQAFASVAYAEVKRIEKKFSRYRDDNIVYQINHARGKAVRVDDETRRLLNYADQLYHLSDGLFDITSGVLRRVWHFDGGSNIPDQKAIASILPLVGWSKIILGDSFISLPESMEIDFGGIGKEYAVDRSAQLLRTQGGKNFLINYGGDLYASGPRLDGGGWMIGLDDPAHTGKQSLSSFELTRGGVATSGDARRFLLSDGVRYSHILHPRTGWPVAGAPRSVTVVAPSCTEAGMLATFGMLHGAGAKEFLEQQDVKFWCY